MLGAEETVNAVDPATIGACTATALRQAGDGAVVSDDYASKHGLKVGDTLTVTSLKGIKLPLKIRAIEDTPSVDVLSLGPITVANATLTARSSSARADDAGRRPGGRGRALDRRVPDAKAESKADFIDSQTAWIGQILAILRVLLALAVIVSLRIVNTLVLSSSSACASSGRCARSACTAARCGGWCATRA